MQISTYQEETASSSVQFSDGRIAVVGVVAVLGVMALVIRKGVQRRNSLSVAGPEKVNLMGAEAAPQATMEYYKTVTKTYGATAV